MRELIRHIIREYVNEQREKWNEDRLKELTSKYNTLSDFLKNEMKAAYALRRLGLYDEFTSHMDRPKSYSEEEIEKEARKYSNQADFAKGSPLYYQAFKRKKLQNKFREFLPTKIRKWSNDELRKEAEKYSSMIEFLTGSQSAYKTAYERGILDDITSHIPKTKKWTYDEAKNEAEKYETFADFVKNSPAYYQSEKNGWTEDFKKFLKLGKYEWKKYTKDMVIADVAKSVNRNDFRSKFPVSYKAARENGWYEEVTAPLIKVVDDRNRIIYAYEFPDNTVYVGLTVTEKRRKFDHLNITEPESPVAQHILDSGLQPSYKIIAKDLSPKEAQEFEGCTEEKYKSEGWTILNRYKTGSLGACRRFWDKESIYDAAKNFETSSDFKKGNNPAYQAAQKYGYLKDITSNMKRVDRTIWNYERSKELASKVNSRAELKYASQSAYASALKNGWLDEFFPKK